MYKATTFSTERKKGGIYLLTADALTSLAALDGTNSVRDVLDILSTITKDSHVVTSDSIGKASHIDAT